MIITLKYIIEGHSEGNIFPFGTYGRNIHSMLNILVPISCHSKTNKVLDKLTTIIENKMPDYEVEIKESITNQSLVTDSLIALDIIEFYVHLSAFTDLSYFDTN